MNLNNPMKQYYQLIYENAKSHGLGELESKILALLCLSEDEMTLDFLAEQTGYSLASVSNAIKLLSRINLVDVFTKPGSKKLFLKGKKSGIGLLSEKLKNTLIIENKKQLEQLPIIKKELHSLLKKSKSASQKKKLKQDLDLISEKLSEAKVVEEVIQAITSILKKRGLWD